MSIRVMLVDDQVLLRTGFRMVLAAQPDMEVVAEAGDGAEAIENLRSTTVDVVLMDVRMPRLDGVEATRRICAVPGAPKVLILTTFDLDEYAFTGLRAGASGFMLKDVPPGELLSAIRSVHSGDAVVAPSTTRRLLDRFSSVLPSSAAPQHKELDRLTEREREVMMLVAQGLSNGEIAGPAGALRGHREDPCGPHPHQTRSAGPGAGGGPRLRDRPGAGGRRRLNPTWASLVPAGPGRRRYRRAGRRRYRRAGRHRYRRARGDTRDTRGGQHPVTEPAPDRAG